MIHDTVVNRVKGSVRRQQDLCDGSEHLFSSPDSSGEQLSLLPAWANDAFECGEGKTIRVLRTFEKRKRRLAAFGNSPESETRMGIICNVDMGMTRCLSGQQLDSVIHATCCSRDDRIQ